MTPNTRSGVRQAALQWQAGYGVVSFGTRDLKEVIAYVQNQREHDARETAEERLERITQFDGDAGANG